MPRLLSVRFVLVGAVILLLAGCGEDRPTVGEWQPMWDALVASIPAETELGDPPDEAACGAVLANLRTVSGDMTPTPDQVIDRAVREWIEIAETAFFECPPEGNEIDSMAAAYTELQRIEAVVVAAIDAGV